MLQQCYSAYPFICTQIFPAGCVGLEGLVEINLCVIQRVSPSIVLSPIGGGKLKDNWGPLARTQIFLWTQCNVILVSIPVAFGFLSPKGY